MDFPEHFKLNSTGEDEQTPEIDVSIDAFSRPVSRFRVKPRKKSRPISVYVAHLKSKRPTDVTGSPGTTSKSELTRNTKKA